MDTQRSFGSTIKHLLLPAISIGIIGGALFESFYTLPRFAPYLFLVVALGLTMAGAVGRKSLLILGACTALSLSFVVFQFHQEKERMIFDHARFGQGSIVFEGKVIRDPDIRSTSAKLVVSDGDSRILATVPRNTPVLYGDLVRVEGIPIRPESFETDTGKQFDYPGYLAKDRIFYEVKYPAIEVVGHSGSALLGGLYRIKHRLVAEIDEIFGGEEGGLLSGILLGEKAGLSDETKDAFIQTGTIHIVALSGYNVTIVAEAITWATRKAVGYTAGIIFGIFGIALFAVMTGLGATIVRASIMAVLALVARMYGREAQMGRALLFAGAVMVALNPWILAYDVSFQLSFLATLGLIYGTPIMERWFMWITRKGGLREVLSTTLATNIAVIPFVIYKMGLASIVSIPVNVLIIPFIPYIMFAGFLTIMLSFAYAPLALPSAFISEKALNGVLELIRSAGDLPFASVTIRTVPLWLVVLFYTVLTALLIVWRKKNKGRLHAAEKI